MRYQVYNLEAWAAYEEDDLWDINSRVLVGYLQVDNSDITSALIEEGFLKPMAKSRVKVEEIGESTIRILDKKNFQPIYDLVVEESES